MGRATTAGKPLVVHHDYKTILAPVQLYNTVGCSGSVVAGEWISKPLVAGRLAVYVVGCRRGSLSISAARKLENWLRASTCDAAVS